MLETLVVDQHGTKLAYTDSGPPSDAYMTVFAVHGMAFNSGIFERVQELAKNANLRFVAVSRRNYQTSSPFTEEELKVVTGGSEEDKTAFVINRGVELLMFIDKFLTEKQVALQTRHGRPCRIAIIGWSLGNAVTLSAIANIKSVAPHVQARLAPLIDTLILHEPSSNIIGHALDPRTWAPLNFLNPLIPKSVDTRFFAWWVSSYFQHGDLSTQNPDELQYHVPGFNLRPPTVYSLTSDGRGSVIEPEPVKFDTPFLINFPAQFLASYNALFSKEIRGLFPNMKAFFIGCDQSPSFGPATTWMVHDHDQEHGGGFIKSKMLNGLNHFSAWDDPEITFQAYQDCIARTF